jgi:hypothetical protein
MMKPFSLRAREKVIVGVGNKDLRRIFGWDRDEVLCVLIRKTLVQLKTRVLGSNPTFDEYPHSSKLTP